MVREAVYKITENCTCNCKFCDSREKYEKILKGKTMTFNEWKKITDELIKNGLEIVVLSGGEPLLMEDITFKLINYLKGKGIYTVLNTSGILFENNKLFNKLLNNYPSLLVFSIDSCDPIKHDLNRSTKGLYSKVVDAIQKIKKAGNYPIAIRTVITKNNYYELTNIIEKFSQLGVDCIKLTNIENDTEGNFRLSYEELIDFDKNIRGQIIEVIKKCKYEDLKLIEENLKKVNHLLNESVTSYENISNGFFSPELIGNTPCDLNGRFFAIQSNGDVLPCCEAEHHYYPVLGNILNSKESEMLNSSVYKDFESNRLDYCKTCTQKHNIQLDFTNYTKKVDRR